MSGLRTIPIEVSPGELLDKLTILELKAERLESPAQRANVERERALLRRASEASLPSSPALEGLIAELRQVNAALWEIEDAIRRCEAAGDFGPGFIELARSVYRQNDRRSAVKRAINELLDSPLVEEKQYAAY